MEVLEMLGRERCTAILRTDLGHAVRPAMRAAIDGGFRIVEFTLTTPEALEHIEHFAGQTDLVVGAGTVLSIEDAEAAVAAGARFLVSPVTDPELIGWCASRDVLAIPGTFTPTEMHRAVRAGAEVCKLFPAPSNGPDYVKLCLGPMPSLRILPTAGVTLENAAAFLRSGAFAVGFVGSLFRPEDLRNGAFDTIRRRAAEMTAAVRGASSRIAS
ncbi:MAG: bifunctional 4-hydroxy-2-oxoglutarate aldolase/2-dehydro-3-deoxy-phosphogluconate aldolase [Planctomycetes bacterium]|nr:bifunctional 4-hydroxy-2-oxoglutarate aldolase/2-dehydro-3-deoxy-phosphogluconate aldolase [Planctomycetota bacterium]